MSFFLFPRPTEVAARLVERWPRKLGVLRVIELMATKLRLYIACCIHLTGSVGLSCPSGYVIRRGRAKGDDFAPNPPKYFLIQVVGEHAHQ